VSPRAADGAGGAAVTVAVPAYQEEQQIAACLEAVSHQTYPDVVEILVVDGMSTDRTREIADGFDKVRVLDNPRRKRPSALNIAIAEAAGDIIVRVDARTKIAPDYVMRCVGALQSSGAAIVGGPMRFTAKGPMQRGIAAAMRSRLGAGPAQFRREEGVARFVDTVYLGAYRVDWIRAAGGYDEDFGGNEDAELNHRAQAAGGVWLDPAISSTYAVREGLPALWRQYRRYGRMRAGTMWKHPRSISARQLAVPGLVVGLASPLRRGVAASYLSVIGARGLVEAARDPAAAPFLAAALPVMHAAWATGFAERIASSIAHRAAPARLTSVPVNRT
jgi:succinoglycan biosynthesis protein ExoA